MIQQGYSTQTRAGLPMILGAAALWAWLGYIDRALPPRDEADAEAAEVERCISEAIALTRELAPAPAPVAAVWTEDDRRDAARMGVAL